MYFFGAPVSPEKLKDYTEHHAMTYHFPDAYAGQNTKIRDTLNNLITKSPQSWQTSVALPFFNIQGTVVEWDEIRFDVRLMQRVPYEGVSRMQTSLRRMDLSPGKILDGVIVHCDQYGNWAKVPGFENELWVSSLGWTWQFDVRRKVWLSPSKNEPRPKSGDVMIGHRDKDHRVHRLMAISFFGPPPSPSHTVDHIQKHGGDIVRERSDNRIENLRWASKSEQSLNRNKQKPRRDGRPVLLWRCDEPRETALWFPSSLKASQVLKLNAGSVSRAANGLDKNQIHGWHVEFAPTSEPAKIADDETFRAVDGFFVSQYGRALDPQTKQFAFTPQVNKGLWAPYLSKGDGKGGSITFAFHALVAKAWPEIVGEKPPADGYTIDHKNRDPSDNRASNLRWAAAQLQQTNKNPYAKNKTKQSTAIEMKAPGTHSWMRFASQCEAARSVNAEFGTNFRQGVISDRAKAPYSGRAILKGKHKGWSIRSAEQ